MHDVELVYDIYRLGWSERIFKLKQKLRAANSKIAELQKQLNDSYQVGTSKESEEIASLRRIVGELSKSIGTEKVEVQWLKLQLICEQQNVKDVEAESEVLRKQRRELEGKFLHINRMYIDGLLKKKELEEEILRLKQALVMAEVNSPKSEEFGSS